EIDGPTEQFVASMVFDGNLFFMSAGFPDHHVMGIRPDGTGIVTDTHVAWHQTSAKCYVPSPVVLDGYLIVADDRGTANCFDASTGEPLWKERLGTHFSASLIHANGLVYLIADDGITSIVRPGSKLDVIAENPLGEASYASPAVSDGQLFIRGERNLYCIEQQTAAGN
ncbi:MAG: PQQ-binding-like beta-propeller repeat protein, partial [Planctomycetota bacterium]